MPEGASSETPGAPLTCPNCLEDVEELTDQVRTIYSIEDDSDALPVNGDILYRS